MSEFIFDSSKVAFKDTSREPHKETCPDCGRVYLNGENVTWQIPTNDGYRNVWSGCADCWLIRTNPGSAK